MGQPWTSLHNEAYQVDGVLGEGGMAVVLAGTRLSDGVPVAIKVLKPQEHIGAEARRRFLLESQIASQLDHPALLKVDECFEEDDRTFMVMERMAGTVPEWVARFGCVPPALAIRQLLHILDGLCAAHAQGVVHRDIKPDNLLINAEGMLVLGDFGVAQLRDENTIYTATGVVLGTLAFMAPEQKTDASRVGPQADIYALGATLAWMLTRRLPFDLYVDDQRSHALAALHPDICGVIDRACRYQPEARYQTTAQMAEALIEIREHFPSSSLTERFDAIPARPPSGIVAGTLPQTDTGLSPTHSLSSRPEPRGRSIRTALILLTGIGVGLAGTRWLADEAPAAVADDPSTAWVDVRDLEPCEEGVHAHRLERRMGPRETQGVAAADLDGDGQMDMIFINQLDRNMSIYWGSEQVPLAVESGEPVLVDIGRSRGNPAIGDLNGDGRLDLVILRPDTADLVVWLSTGDRRWEAQAPIFQGEAPHDGNLVDWNGDGDLDLIFLMSDGIAVRPGDGQGGFEGHQRLLGDRDVNKSLAFMGEAGPEIWYRRHLVGGRSTIMRLVGDGKGGIVGRKQVTPPHAPPWQMGVAPGSQQVYLWGSWRLGPLVRLSEEQEEWTGCQLGILENGNPGGVADLNGDGMVDLIGYTTCAGCKSNHEVGLAIP
jgi:eukaryotic-like serine/threonine-protein kinase